MGLRESGHRPSRRLRATHGAAAAYDPPPCFSLCHSTKSSSRTGHAPSSSNGRLTVRLSLAVWGTGQDQVAVIKRQLQLMLPGVSIFLDVDDLEDIGALEE